MAESFDLSRSQQYLQKKAQQAPPITPNMLRSVSGWRRSVLEEEVAQGRFSDGSGNSTFVKDGTLGTVVGSRKNAMFGSESTSGSGHGWRGAGGSFTQVPEIYSPLWLNSNLNLPRDRATINAWARAFFVLNPIVHNAISLHATYPISKLLIKCKDKRVEKFFAEMIEEIDLMNICVQIAQEYWLLGEAFIYGDMDESQGKWSRLLIQNPDYIVVAPSAVAGQTQYSLRPDENLRRVVSGNRPIDIQQRSSLSPEILDYVKRGQNIPLDDLKFTHLARKISPYETRGSGLPVTCFKALMLWDQLRESKYAQAANMINPLTLVKIGGPEHKPQPADLEAWREVFACHDEQTEVLTSEGFKKFNEVIDYSMLDGQPVMVSPKSGIKIGCFNPENKELEYYEPSKAHLHQYNGEMIAFKSKNMDIMVTPEHDMWIEGYTTNKKIKSGKVWRKPAKVKAKDVLDSQYHRFRTTIGWKGKEVEFIEILGKQIPIKLYMKFLGYLISEGCLEQRKYTYTAINQLTFTQNTTSDCYEDMRQCVDQFAEIFEVESRHRISDAVTPVWQGMIYSKKLVDFFIKEITNGKGRHSNNKIIPRSVLELSTSSLQILLDALIAGDGHEVLGLKCRSVKYFTASFDLAQGVQEAAFKCGHAPTAYIVHKAEIRKDGTKRNFDEWAVSWSTSTTGKFPCVHNHIKKVNYQGKVWCLTIPTGLFVTRRNGRITVQGNSVQYDKDAKVFCHNEVAVERVGYNSGILDISGDITQLIKEIYMGLMVPAVIMDGGADTTYANGGVALDVLRQRYLTFRNMMTAFLRRKIFAPIAMANEFFEYKDGERHLIVPDVDWNYMSLFDAGDYIQSLMQLTAPDQNRASIHTLYRSLGLDWEDERRRMRAEAVQTAIHEKEKVALAAMKLTELRALKDEDEIKESEEGPLPGEQVPGVPPPGLPGPEMIPPPPGPEMAPPA